MPIVYFTLAMHGHKLTNSQLWSAMIIGTVLGIILVRLGMYLADRSN